MINIGKRVRNIRESKGITQEELANKMDVTKSYVSKIESGDQIPKLARLELIAIGLDVTLEELIFNTSVDSKWKEVIELFEQKGINPEEVLKFISVLEKLK
ncbi:helix-turn-helix domain-containing protein [Heyndrickxia camelliae]|uniref:helix-turn-helix domain-containing protein n=1 Tax=Heyndrickxia camelliae TaxID=1707093 RepID=UPI0013FE276A|nr:helix-turn-helix transcriptional regulator [Heyndrickxia camelliae]